MSGVQKLNMMANRFEKARAHPDVCARSRCCGTSAAYAYPIAEAPVVENVAMQAKKTYACQFLQCYPLVCKTYQ